MIFNILFIIFSNKKCFMVEILYILLFLINTIFIQSYKTKKGLPLI